MVRLYMTIDTLTTWAYDRDGYALTERGSVIARKGGALVIYPIAERARRLLIDLADVKDAEGALNFTKSYGLLRSCDANEQTVADVVEQARRIRSYMVEFALDGIERHPEVIARYNDDLPTQHVTARMVLTAGNAELQLKPVTLLGEAWLMLGEHLAAGSVLRNCEWCGDPFVARVSANSELTQRFCRATHQQMFWRREKAKAKAKGARK